MKTNIMKFLFERYIKMKLIQLRYFQGICRYGSVTKAAKELHISQPSVTSSIQELESELGVNLFHRHGKRLILTQEGEFFLKQAENILERVDTLEETMKDLGGRNNHIRIGVPPMIGTFLFPDMFNEFNKMYPYINLEIQEYGSQQTKQQVEEELIDLAIVVLDEQTEERFHYLPIISTQLVYCVDYGNPLSKMKTINISEIGRQPLILMKSDSFQNVVINQKFEEAGIKPNVLFYSNQLYTIKRFVQHNNIGAFLFEEIILHDSDIVGIPFDPPIPIPIGLIWKKDKYMYSSATDFINFTKKYHYKR